MTQQESLHLQDDIFKLLYTDYKLIGNVLDRSSSEMNGLTNIISFEYNSGINNDPVLAQFYFIPENSDNIKVLNLVQTLTIRDDIDTPELKTVASKIVNELNYINPYGVFVLDPNYEILSFRNVIHIYEGLPKNNIAKFVLGSVQNGIGLLSHYIAEINTLLDGRIEWDRFVELVRDK